MWKFKQSDYLECFVQVECEACASSKPIAMEVDDLSDDLQPIQPQPAQSSMVSTRAAASSVSTAQSNSNQPPPSTASSKDDKQHTASHQAPTPRKDSKVQSQDPKDSAHSSQVGDWLALFEWPCARCTVINQAARNHCSVCDAPKPA